MRSTSRKLSVGRVNASQSKYSGFGSFSHCPVCGFFLLLPTANRNFTTVLPVFGRVRGGSGLSVSRPINMTLFSVAMCDLRVTAPQREIALWLRVVCSGVGHFPKVV